MGVAKTRQNPSTRTVANADLSLVCAALAASQLGISITQVRSYRLPSLERSPLKSIGADAFFSASPPEDEGPVRSMVGMIGVSDLDVLTVCCSIAVDF